MSYTIFMNLSKKTFLIMSGIIFLIVSILHLLRIIFSLQVLVGNLLVRIPMWFSLGGLIISAYLAYEAFRLAK